MVLLTAAGEFAGEYGVVHPAARIAPASRTASTAAYSDSIYPQFNWEGIVIAFLLRSKVRDGRDAIP
jgi:hypothetical protein